jgi:ferredoxin
MNVKAVIYCFSGTGNTLTAARSVASGLENCQVIRVTASALPASTDASVIGFASPVYAWGLPAIMARLIRNIQFHGNPYFFSLITSGGMPGATNYQIRNILRERGQDLAAGFAITMPGNYTPMYGAISPEKQKKLFQKAASEIPLMAETVKARKTCAIRNDNRLICFLFSKLLYPLAIKSFTTADKKFRPDDKCNGCGICAKVCPVSDIKMESGKPVWLGHCEQCMACLQWCPQEALQCGSITAKRKRYHHPDTQVSDFIVRS